MLATPDIAWRIYQSVRADGTIAVGDGRGEVPARNIRLREFRRPQVSF